MRKTLGIAFVLALSAAACGPSMDSTGDGDGDGDGDGGGDGDGDGCTNPSCYNFCPNGTATSITGRVLMPNGIDPVPQAIVYVPKSSVTEFPTEVRCEICDQITDSAKVSVVTNDDGSFTLTPVPTVMNAQPFTIQVVAQKGRFRKLVDVQINNVCAGNNFAGQEFKLPGANAGFDHIPNIAVATGDYDTMECVLKKIGLQDGSFDLYDGQSLGGMGTGFNSLLQDLNLMKTYNIIFINCADNTWESTLTNPTIRANVRDYVQSGGRLYVTDWSYDYIEQIEEFCPIIDFGPGPSANNATTPEPANAAAIGDDGITTEASVLDEGLQRWLQAVEAVTGQEVISPSNTVHIEHFLIGWVMQHSVPVAENVKVWLQGNVTGDGLSGNLPLTTTFDYNSCGRGLYSSYHTLGRDPFDFGDTPFPEYCPSGQLSPQERVLEYLILEIADCIDPVE